MSLLPQSPESRDRRLMRVYTPAAALCLTLLIGFMEGNL